MATMALSATGSLLTVTTAIHLTSTQVEYDVCQFTFDAAWAGYDKTAVFYADATNVVEVVLVADACDIPWDAFAANKRYLYIGVYGTSGTSVLPTNFVEVAVAPGANIDGTPSTPPTASVYAQLLANIDSLADALTALTPGSPAGTYADLAALNTVDPDHAKIYITLNDGAWCYYDTGTSAFVAGGTYQATAVADGSVTLEKLSFITRGKNLFNWASCVAGSKFDAAGELTADVLYCYTPDFIKLTTETDLVANAIFDYVFYDSSQAFVSKANKAAGASIAVPGTAAYLKLDGVISMIYKAGIQVESGVTSTDYEPYNVEIPNLKTDVTINPANMTAIDAHIALVSRVVYPLTKNLFDYQHVTDGVKIGATGLDEADANYAASFNYIYISGITDMVGNMITGAAFYTSDFTFISKTSKAAGAAYTVPGSTAYVRFYGPRANIMSPSLQVEEGVAMTSVVAFRSSSSEESDPTPDPVIVTAVSIPENPVSVALSGSSITWGGGLLDDSFAEYVDEGLRNDLATTVLISQMDVSGTNAEIVNSKFYGASALKLEGADATASFGLEGNELSICIGRERGNAGAAIVELYVDDALYDTFSTYNDEPSGSDVENFVGDGSAVTFDLGRAFTYNHVVTVGGVAKTGGMNTQGAGATIPDDYLIIRKYAEVSGVQEVHHYVWFAAAPGNGVAVSVAFDYGENVMYTRSTVGETTAAINGTLESAYGDGDLSYDPALPSAISSGLDYRYTDMRSILTWRFESNESRSFRLLIKELDPRGSGTETLYLNFATNRLHKLMNAGIGGYTASALDTDDVPVGIEPMMNELPDTVILEYGTNDDWDASFVSYRQVTGVTEAVVRRYPTIWLKSCAYVGANNYTIETSVLSVASATRRSVTIDATGVTFGTPAAGDIITIGNYYGDNRAVQSRVITAWDSGTKTASFAEPLQLGSRFGWSTLAGLAGMEVRIRRVTALTTPLASAIDKIITYNPDAQIALIDTGLCNYYTRMLLGYPEAIAKSARDKSVDHIKTYDALMAWQHSQTCDTPAYLTTALNTTSDGSATYALVTAADADPNGTSNGYRQWSVKVDDVERYGFGCHISGGRMYAFADATADEDLTVTNWNGKTATGVASRNVPLVLTFTSDVPAIAAEIVVTYSTAKWSSDDCHLAAQPGAQIIGDIIANYLTR